MSYTIKQKSHTLDQLTASLRGDWENLARTIDANPSLYPDWTGITANSHGIATRVELLTAQRDDETVGLFPVHISSLQFLGFRLRSLSLVSNSVSYHNNLLSRLDVKQTISLLVQQAAHRNAAVLHLAGIPDETELASYLTENPRTPEFRVLTVPGEVSPYLPLAGSWDELIASKPKKFRYKLRKRAESLINSNSLRMRWFDKPENHSELFNAIQVVEENSWKKDAGVSIFEKDKEERYHESLLPDLLSKKALFANVLFHDNLPIAYNLCCVWNGWIGQMKTSFDTRFSDLSPGALVIDLAIQHAFQLNASEFDFLGDKDRHKLAWTKKVRGHTDYFLYLRSSVKGNLIGLLKSTRKRLS